MYQNYKIMKTQDNFFFILNETGGIWIPCQNLTVKFTVYYSFENKTWKKCEKSNGRELKYF